MKIHTFGDSHSMFGFNKIKNININHLGPKLCYTYGNKGLELLNIKNYEVNENDIVIFCFGEIECRCHIHKHISENNTFEKIIDDIIDNYFISIKKNIEQFMKLYVYIYNVVPPVQKHTTNDNSSFPFLGSDEQRKKYTLYFNKKIKEKCGEYNYIFFDIYQKYCDDNGYLNKELSDGHVHINNKIYIEEFIKTNLQKVDE